MTSGHREREGTRYQIRRILDRLVRDGEAVASLDGTVHSVFPVAVSAAGGEALRRWVIHEGAVRTVEVGFGYGISALFVCEGLLSNAERGALHVVIDPNQATRFANLGLQLLDEAGAADLVEHLAEESQIVLPRFLAEGRRFDLAFIDGNHRFDAVFLDLVYLGRLVSPGGIVFLDDYHLQSVSRAACFFVRTSVGSWRTSRPPRISITGPSCVRVTSPMLDRSTTLWTSDGHPTGVADRILLRQLAGTVGRLARGWERE